jgi:type I restriction enzyme, S subunit
MNELLTKGIGHTEFKDSPVGKIPVGWEVKRLSEISERIWIGLVTTMTKFYVEKGTPLIRNSDIKESGVEMHKLIYLDLQFANDNLSRSVKTGDVVTVHTGDVGTSAVIDEKLSGAQGFATLNTRLNLQHMIPEFYSSVLNSDLFKMQVKRVITGDGRDNLNLKDFVKLLIVVPDLIPEQQKIASILTSVDEVIEKTQSQINKLQYLKKGTMNELLTKGIGHTEFKDSPVGKIPKGWEVFSIGNLIYKGLIQSIQDGNHGAKHPKVDDFTEKGIPFVMASDIKKGVLNIGSAKKIPLHIYDGLRIGFAKSGDVLLTHKATIGSTAIIQEHIPHVMLTPQVTYYRVGKEGGLLNRFLCYWFQSCWFQESIFNLSAQSTRSYIGITAQKELLVLLPPLSEQQKIASILSSMDSHIEEKQRKLEQTQSLKKSLMQNLLTGKVRVTVN